MEKIELYVGAGILGVFAIVVACFWISYAHVKAELAEARARGTVCLAMNAEWETKTQQVNAALDKMKSDDVAWREKANEAWRAAEKEAAKHRARAAHLKAVQSGQDDCAAALTLMRQARE